MTWAEYQYANLYRLRVRLLEHHQFYGQLVENLRNRNYPPDHPLVQEAMHSQRQAKAFGELVRAMMDDAAPYRPLADPWKNHGLKAVLRPDFELRGIK